MISKATYGDQIWNEMGSELSHWNKESVALVTNAALSFWFVNIFHFCEYIDELGGTRSNVIQ
jgi:hypothetical protein